ncbi:hypothetical protein BC937DRAFT_93050 [Endogone sp. FLAS-F59071]|nr:hypothetical protein BC937DRAFT_93050 [Endogone sp. FLAS-F59071]|eukprot:RUS14995.1 hypothetical protein BC937DRAFT_93050 [Endogone sp. FLAS-F59071]
MGAYEDWYSFLKRVHDWFRSGLDKMLEDADSVSPSHIKKLGFATISLTRNLRHHHDLEGLFQVTTTIFHSVQFLFFHSNLTGVLIAILLLFVTEAFVFPFFAKKVDISHWAAAHEELIEALDSLQSQGSNAQKNPVNYDSVRFKATIEELKRIVLPHFADEERISLPENTRTLWTEEEFRQLHR